MDNINNGKWGPVTTAEKNAHLSPTQQGALKKLYEKLAQNGYLWADRKADNVFFYNNAKGELTAGILDPDMIFPADKLPTLAEYYPTPPGLASDASTFGLNNKLTSLANLKKGASPRMWNAIKESTNEGDTLSALSVMIDRFNSQFPNFAKQAADSPMAAGGR